ncbi:tetratricopeptide repeat protein [Collinsella vaginalis]|uniref:tetratricopeptide repeat protein n=1 Tax=Collinsella vaginalis TaxID=1870987 RepID=UPI0015C4F481|nr:SEL1-like repeat protein [Collinsella vaginalis]
MSDTSFYATEDDFKQIGKLVGIDPVFISRDEVLEYSKDESEGEKGSSGVSALLKEMGEAAFSPDPDAFAVFAAENRRRIREAALLDESVVQTLILGYRIGISGGSGSCMNDLGALYYMGELVEQDYSKAVELYEMAMDHGCYQSIVNLGYIWEYGRTGTRDYQKAYQYYALAAALVNSSEGLYKLGDMYSRGKAVDRDMAKALQLWSRSLELAKGIVAIAQPAIRIAQLLISDEDCASAGVEPDPLHALSLFQQAEIGLRIDIEDGQTYYERRLEEAIEGQERAREILGMKSAWAE